MSTTGKEKPRWLQARERQRNEPVHEALVKRDAKRGSRRDVYLLRDRIFLVSQGHALKGVVGYGKHEKPDLLLIGTKDGPRRIDRELRAAETEIRDENIKLKRRARRARAQRKARKNQRRLRRRGSHKR